MAKAAWWPSTPDAGAAKPIVWDETMYEGNITYSWGSLSAQVQAQRFWTAASNGAHCAGHSNTALLPGDVPNCTNPNSDGTHGKPLCNPIMWWNKGGALRGDSPPRIDFYRKQMSAPDTPPYHLMSSRKLWEAQNKSEPGFYRGAGVYHLSANDGSWHLVYWLNTTKPIGIPLGSESWTFKVTHLDYWNMTATPLDDVDGKVHHVSPLAENYIVKLVRTTRPTPLTPPTPPAPASQCAAAWQQCGAAGHPSCCEGKCQCQGTLAGAYKECKPVVGQGHC